MPHVQVVVIREAVWEGSAQEFITNQGVERVTHIHEDHLVFLIEEFSHVAHKRAIPGRHLINGSVVIIFVFVHLLGTVNEEGSPVFLEINDLTTMG